MATIITLTDRPPVRIRRFDWPQVAGAKGDSYRGSDYARHQQALGHGELDEYVLRVRKHADGRAIVYAVLDAAPAWTGNESCREGELCDPGADLAAVIRRVGDRCGLPDAVIRECIAALPAEDL